MLGSVLLNIILIVKNNINPLQDIVVKVATKEDVHYAQEIVDEMAASAKVRGTGIAKRTAEYVATKMLEGKAVIALSVQGEWVGFCYIEEWEHGEFVANSGLIVSPNFRKSGVAKKIKAETFALSRKKYPTAKIFGLTTGLAVMKINSELGYKPVTYSELTTDDAFWSGCKSCVNYDILLRKERSNCMCTAMLFEPKNADYTPEETKEYFEEKKNIFARLFRLKENRFLKKIKK